MPSGGRGPSRIIEPFRTWRGSRIAENLLGWSRGYPGAKNGFAGERHTSFAKCEWIFEHMAQGLDKEPGPADPQQAMSALPLQADMCAVIRRLQIFVVLW
jgi:hypothetical protein